MKTRNLILALLAPALLVAQDLNMNNLILDEELSAIRAITVTKKATFSDLCKIVLIHANQLEKYATDEERCARVKELSVYDTASVDHIHLMPLTKGAALKAAINLHGLEKTLTFRLLGWEWYAMQNGEALGLIEKGSNSWDTISGEELINVMDAAMAKAAEKKGWMQEKNPYKEFGFDSYKDMDAKSKALAPVPLPNDAAAESESKGTNTKGKETGN
ncbi:MAG: hypothetical protein LDLANPLL_00083 [Turneriella sp.]|nr:hypothetical protein [Turneriella sp.]